MFKHYVNTQKYIMYFYIGCLVKVINYVLFLIKLNKKNISSTIYKIKGKAEGKYIF